MRVWASAVCVVLVLGCQHDVVAPVVATAPTRVVRTVRVIDVHGQVTRLAPDGTRVDVVVGKELDADDELSTSAGGSARLDVGGTADVEIAAETKVSVGALTDTLSKVRLRDGRIAAVVHGARHGSLQVEVPGSSAMATSSDGEFSMLASGSRLSVAAKSGQVVLAARGRSVRIGASQLSLVERDQPPSAPEAIPPSLFLKLGAARAVTQREKSTTVRGSTAPGAIVSINGVKLSADRKGEFATVVPLKEGANTLVVESSDVLGRRQRGTWPRITVDTRAPDTKTKVQW